MAELIDTKDVTERCSDADVRAAMRKDLSKGLSQTFKRRFNSRTPRTPRTPPFGGQVEHCGTEYKTFVDPDGEGEVQEDLSQTQDMMKKTSVTRMEKRKLVIIMVGLPGRGKTYLCNKIMCYLNWCAPLMSCRTAAVVRIQACHAIAFSVRINMCIPGRGNSSPFFCFVWCQCWSCLEGLSNGPFESEDMMISHQSKLMWSLEVV
jgi:hypothetical protein